MNSDRIVKLTATTNTHFWECFVVLPTNDKELAERRLREAERRRAAFLTAGRACA